MSAQWMEYKGKPILFVDFRDLKPEQVVATVELEAQMLAGSPNKALVLANVTGASVSTLDSLKRLGKGRITPKVAKSALLGVTGLKDILLRSYNIFTGSSARPFSSEAEALEWLVS